MRGKEWEECLKSEAKTLSVLSKDESLSCINIKQGVNLANVLLRVKVFKTEMSEAGLKWVLHQKVGE
jgi:hypothetical protein